MKSRVTAAIPAYNCERYLTDALQSVLDQSRPPDEILVVDDGSTDSTPSIARNFSNVRYIRKHNEGDASARNRAIDEAAGDFIAFLDADDLWRKEKLQKQMDLFEVDGSLGMVYSGVEVVDEELRALRVLRPAPPEDAFRNTLLVEKPYITGVGSTAVVRIEVARKVRFDERLRASSDWAFGCFVALHHPVGIVDEPLALYRQHGLPQVHLNIDAVEQDMHLVWKELFSSPLLTDLRRYRRRAAANLDLSLAYSSYQQGLKSRAWRLLARAILRRPDRVAAAFWRRYMGD